MTEVGKPNTMQIDVGGKWVDLANLRWEDITHTIAIQSRELGLSPSAHIGITFIYYDECKYPIPQLVLHEGQKSFRIPLPYLNQTIQPYPNQMDIKGVLDWIKRNA